MRDILPVVGACLCLTGLVGSGCRSDDPGNCGRPVPGGGIRFCSDDETNNQVCICATGRCAEGGHEDCDFGLRYAYGDQECVSEQDLMAGGYVLSDGSGAACHDVPTAQPPLRYVEEPRVDPRLLRFGDGVLLETVDPYPLETESLSDRAPAHAFVHRLDWNGRPEEGPGASADARADVAPLVKLALRGAHSWAACDNADPGPRSALFAHWVHSDIGWWPVLVRAWLDGVNLQVDNPTKDVFGALALVPNRILALRVVGSSTGCWVAWIEDRVGSRTELVVRALRVSPAGSVEGGARDLISTDANTTFWSVPMFSDVPPASDPRLGLMAGSDGRDGLVVAVPVRNTLENRVALWAREVRVSGEVQPTEHAQVADFPEGSPECAGGGCRGVVFPESNGIAAQGDRIYFAYVLEGWTGEHRKLHIDAIRNDLSDSPSSTVVGDLSAPLTAPAIVPRPEGGVFGAVMGWSGDVPASSAPLHLFYAVATEDAVDCRTQTLPNPTAVAPRLAVDDGGFLYASFLTLQGESATSQRLVRFQPMLHATAPTWPENGVPCGPAGHEPGGNLLSSAANPLPRSEGGILTAWTTQDRHVEIALVEAVL